jgi:hypothetical protein
MTQRLAPKTGYRFREKWGYRASVWDAFAERVPNPKNHAWVCLPSSEGHELLVAQERGFDLSQAHIVDKNPAIVASLKRKYPEVTTYGVDLVTALQRMGTKLKGKFPTIFNFDLCGNIVGQSDILHHAGREIGLFHGGSIDRWWFAVTLLGGRDKRFKNGKKDGRINFEYFGEKSGPALAHLPVRHAGRLMMAVNSVNAGYNYCNQSDADTMKIKDATFDWDAHMKKILEIGSRPHVVRAGRYLSSGVPMIWAVVEVVKYKLLMSYANSPLGSPKRLYYDGLKRLN